MKKIITFVVALATTLCAMAQQSSSMNFVGSSDYTSTMMGQTISGSDAKATMVVGDANSSLTLPAMTVMVMGNQMTIPSIKYSDLTSTTQGSASEGTEVRVWQKGAYDFVVNVPGEGNKTVKVTSLDATYSQATGELTAKVVLTYGSMPGAVTFTETGYYTTDNKWNLAGQGTEANPYRILEAADFNTMAAKCNAELTGMGEYFKVMNDIDFKGTAEIPVPFPCIAKAAIKSISDISYGFQGVLDGNNKSVSGIYNVNNKNDQAGKNCALISSLGEDGVVKNLTFTKDNYITGYNYLSTFVSLNKGGEIENCVNYADATAVNMAASGICSYICGGKGMVKNCTNYGNMVAMSYAAGILSGAQSGAAIGKSDNDYANITVEGCTNSGNIMTTNGTGSAGISGNYSGNIINCTNTGTIDDSQGTAKTIQYTGGIAGSMTYVGKVYGNVNRGTVKGVNKVGGIVGYVMKGGDDILLLCGKDFGNVNLGNVIGTNDTGSVLGGTLRSVAPILNAKQCDVNGDGKVDIDDVSTVINDICTPSAN